MADRYADEATRSLRKIGFGVRPDVTARYATLDEPGRADLMAVRARRGVYIEVKSGKLSFDFDNWRPNQREWWLTYCAPDPYSMELYIWLVMGTDRPNANPDKYHPRKVWLIPAADFLQVEAAVKPIQDSLPYRVGKGYRRELCERQLDAVHLLAQWELLWASSGVWNIPNSHDFYRNYIAMPHFIALHQETANHDPSYRAS